MSRFLRCLPFLVALSLALLVTGDARAQTCGNNNSGSSGNCDSSGGGGGSSCTSTGCTRVYTSAPLLGRDANDRCLYQCNWTNTTTDSCGGQTSTNGSAYQSAGPWATDYCEPAVNPPFFCGYFFGTSC